MAIKVKAIIGSTSSTSFNLKLVEYMRNRYADQLDITPVFINDLETFSIDIESNPPANVKEFKDNVKDSDAVLFAVPEYNFSIPGAMKNAIDWLSRGGDFTIQRQACFHRWFFYGSIRKCPCATSLKRNPFKPSISTCFTAW